MNRVQSQHDKDVWIAAWDCPMAKRDHLSFCGMIEIKDIRFFLFGETTSYVVTIQRYSPFRVIEEGYMDAFQKFFKLSSDDEKKLPSNRCYKLWGSPFVKELNSLGLLFLGRSEEEKFEYCIATNTEWIQFISLEPVQIEVFPERDIDKLIVDYTKRDLLHRRGS